MVRHLSLAAVAVLLGLAAWLVFFASEPWQDPVARGREIPAGSEARIESPLETLERAQGPSGRTSATKDESESEHDGSLLVVVDGKTGRGQCNARVYWLDEDRLERALADPVARLSGDPEQLYFQHGIELTTGPTGRVRLPASDQRSLAYCRVEDTAGKLWIARGERSDLRLELALARDLFVRVVDREGRGVDGVPVTLHSSLHGSIAYTRSFSTRPEGLTRVHGGAAYLVAAPQEQTFEVGVPAEHDAAPRVRVDRITDEAHPFEIRLLGLSRLRVVVELGAEAELVPQGNVDVVGPSVVGLNGLGKAGAALVAGRRADFWLVQAPGSLSVTARLESPLVALTATIPGPGAPGTELEFVLPTSLQTIVRVRALDSLGRPLKTRRVQVWTCVARASRQDGRGELAEVDGRGLLHFAWETQSSDPSRRQLVLLMQDGESARLELPVLLPHPIADLGEVRFAPSRLLARGRVLLADGAPARHARVHLTILGAETSSSAACDSWSEPTQSDGTFEFEGAVSGPRVRLLAEWPSGCGSEPLDVAVGSEDVELRFGPRGAIGGSLELPDGVREGRFTLELEADPSIGRGPPHEVQLESNGAFRIMDVCPGSYDLVVGERDSGKTLRIEGLVVRSNETLHDIRLQSIRVTELLR